MGEVSKERIWLYDGVVYHRRPGPDDQDIECDAYVLASLYEAERALNAELVKVLKGACDAFERLADEMECDPVVRDAATNLWRAALAKAEEREKGDE